jgi:DNA-binding winged helix-turn-helix (wHTH) protein
MKKKDVETIVEALRKALRLVGDQVVGTFTNKGAGLVVAISGRLEPERAILEYQGGGAQVKRGGEGRTTQ